MRKVTVKHRSYKSFSGPMIACDKRVSPPLDSSCCIDRQHWLTTKVETGATYGTVVMYDGTAITAGPDQFILVFPRQLASEDYNAANDQGPLTKLLRRLEVVEGLECCVEALWNEFAAHGWYVSNDGFLRYLEARKVKVGARTVHVKGGDKVHGTTLRNTITPLNGTVPRNGENWKTAVKFGMLVHDLFSNPCGFLTQDAFGRERMVKAFTRRRIGDKTISEILCDRESIETLKLEEICPELELAIGMWYSNSVNAPAIAMKKLKQCLKSTGIDGPQKAPEAFAKRLIRLLGTTRYGRWDSEIPGGRYQRTRKHAMQSQLWPKELFVGKAAVMPAKL